MTTTLVQFYARAFTLVALLVFFILLLAGVALAQEGAPAAASPGAPLIPAWLEVVIQGVIAAVGACLTAASIFLTRYSPAWLKNLLRRGDAEFDLKKTLDAMHWDEHVAKAFASAFGYASAEMAKKDASEVKTPIEAAAFLQHAHRYIGRQNGEIFDEHGNGWTTKLLQNKLAQVSGVRVTPAVNETDDLDLAHSPAPAQVLASERRARPKGSAADLPPPQSRRTQTAAMRPFQ